MEISLVMIPIDFSEAAAASIRYAKEMVKCWQSQFVGIHVIDDNLVSHISGYYKEDESAVRERLSNQAHQALRRFVKEHGAADLVKEIVVSHGSPFQEIAIKARELEVDLVLMGGYGSRGKGQIDEIFFGSTVEKVVRLLPCPVLCVPTDWGGE